jgi:hypothetical protein
VAMQVASKSIFANNPHKLWPPDRSKDRCCAGCERD